ncbi:MAG: hypothetical protein GF308_06590 [Candidatus Heimdallarchaeota archaeon]|nr:hypothetical protein [Candidatus Heimdallarchaeota archaeon]
MNKMRKTILGISSFFVIFVLTMTSVIAPTMVNTLHTCEATPDPNVDGKIDKAVEWKAGWPITVTLYDLTNQANKIDIEIISVYGADQIVYYAVTVPDTGINPEDYFFMVFRTHEVDPIVEIPNIDGRFNKEHDVKFMWLHNNHSMDAFTTGTWFNWADDPSNGGSDDGFGKCRNNRSHTTIEMSFPFDTSDLNGFDVILSLNATVELFLWYHDEDVGRDYCQIRENDADWDYLEQIIDSTKCGPIPLPYVFLGLIGISVITVIIRGRRK